MGAAPAQALIFADRLGRELAPLFQVTGPALLPLAQKTPLHYCLDDLAAAGVTHALVVVSHASDTVQAMLAAGQPWGMELQYVLSRGEESPQELLRRFRALLDDTFIAIRGDVLRTPMVKEIGAACADGGHAVATLDGHSVGLALTSGDELEMSALAWPLPAFDGLPMVGHRCSHLDTLEQVLDANLDLAAGRYLGLVPAGLMQQDGVMLGRLSHLDASSVVDPPVSLGDHSSVHRSVRLYGPVVIGENCFIDQDTQVRDSLVLSNSYIGAGLDVKDAIVGEGLLVHPRDDLSMPIDDPLWVAPMSLSRGVGYAQLGDSVLAALLLVLSLPLWVMAGVVASLSDGPVWGQRAVQGNRRDLRGQRREFRLWEFRLKQPVLRALPGLLAVVTGHLRLFGAPPAPLAYAQDMPVHLESPPAGLIAPSSLELDASAPIEEVELFEVCFAAERSIMRELRCWWLGLRALLGRRAWSRGVMQAD